MDYMQFVDYHRTSGADITIGCIAYDQSRASDFGLMKVGRGCGFAFSAKMPQRLEGGVAAAVHSGWLLTRAFGNSTQSKAGSNTCKRMLGRPILLPAIASRILYVHVLKCCALVCCVASD
jgi:hypothetical protein